MNWLSRHRRLVVGLICGLCTGAILLVRFFPGLPFVSAIWGQEQNYQNFLQREGRKTATHSDFVFLGIDQSTLELPPLLPEELENNRGLQLMSEHPFPWSREVWALLLDRLFGAGARLVILDLVCNPPNEGDVIFREALDRYRDRVVLGANIDERGRDQVDSSNGSEGEVHQIVVPNSTLIPPPPLRDDRVGYVNFWSDSLDGIVRAIYFNRTEREVAGMRSGPNDEVFESLTARALGKVGRARDVMTDRKPHPLRFSGNDAYLPQPLYTVFDSKLWRANFSDGTFFKDKVVIVGASAKILHDVVATPMHPEVPGPVLHLQALAGSMDHEFLRYTSTKTNLILVLAGGILAWVLVALVRRPLFSIVGLLATTAAYLTVARIAYDRAGLLIAAVPVLGNFVGGGFISLGFEYVVESIEKLRTRRTLERYVSKNVVREVLDNPESFYSTLRGVRMPATVLFSDIVGFTSLTESADPEALVKQLNEYLSRMTATVFKHNGTLDKFIGDAVMAVWGNVSSRGIKEDAKSCAGAALEMGLELQLLNEKWKSEGIAPFQIGIGINQGDVLCGNIGSQEKADPTVIGDTVNLASRLEGLTRVYGTDILVGQNVRELIQDDFLFRSVALVQVKGKTKPVEIFSLVGARSDPANREFFLRLQMYESGLCSFRERNFAQARTQFSEFLQLYPDDALAAAYLRRAIEYEGKPPPESWSGVEVFKQK